MRPPSLEDLFLEVRKIDDEDYALLHRPGP